MWRGASLLAFGLALGLSLSCRDADEQPFPFDTAPAEEAPLTAEDTAPAEEEAPLEPAEDVVLDAGADAEGAELVDAAFEEPADTDTDTDTDADEGEEDPFAEEDAGTDDADADDAGVSEGSESEEESALLDDGAGTSEDELFGSEGESSGEDESVTSSDGRDGGPAPFGPGAPGMMRQGPITFPPVPPGGVPTMPLYAGETFDVATLAGGYTTVVMQNVAARIDEDINVYVVSLTGALVPVGTDLVDLDRPGDLQLVVDAAEVRISEEDLGRIFSRYLFEEEDSFGSDFDSEAPSLFRDVEVTLERGRVVLKAELEDGGDDVEIRGTLEPTPSGDVAFIPTSLRRDDKPVDALEDIFEEGTGAIAMGDDIGGGLGSVGAGPAVWADADALYFDPEAVLRAPALDADVIDVRTRGKYVRLLLEGNAPEVKTLGPPGDPQNYVELRGGAVRFGKVIMPRADMLFLDADESDPLDLSLHRFDEQVIAGETRLRPDLGLEAVLPDFEDIDDSAFEEADDEEAEGDEGDGGPEDDGRDGGDEGLDDGLDEESESADESEGSRDEELFE